MSAQDQSPLPPAMPPAMVPQHAHGAAASPPPEDLEIEDWSAGSTTFAQTQSPPPSRRKDSVSQAQMQAQAQARMEAAYSSEPEDFGGPEETMIQVRSVGRKVPVQRPQGQVSLIVGGWRFVCETALFLQHPNTMLGRMFSSGADFQLTRPNDDGDYVISQDISAPAFKAILDFYKHGKIVCPANVSVSELHEACNYFLVPFNHDSVKCENMAKLLTELSNRGARCQFEDFVDKKIMSAMARSAQLGERECHIVCLSDDDMVEWDDDLPPRLGEQYAQVIHSSHLVRFLKFHENRDIAKAILKEKGFNHIKIGIEGFPTSIDKMRHGNDGEKLEAEYHYEQRFFIKLSWECQDAKSRHVDFQCVRARVPGNFQAG